MKDGISVIAAGLALILSLWAFFGVLGVFFSGRLSRTRQMVTVLPGRSFWVGAVNFLFLSVLVLIFAQLGAAQSRNFLTIFAILFAAVLCVGAGFGLGVMVEVVGERLAPGASGFLRTGAGTGLLCLACALPFVGWFGLLPFVLFTGFGGFILTFFTGG